ncbi:MAG: cell division protein FtsL [Erysipelothrix sp.]
MAKHVVKKKKRTIRWSGMIGFVFTIAILASFITQTVVKTQNAKITIEVQKAKQEMASVNEDNEKITTEIQKLTDFARISQAAQNAGLKEQQNTFKVQGEATTTPEKGE